MIKELVKIIQKLNENELETLEILLDDETMKALKEGDINPEYFTHKEVFGHDLQSKIRETSPAEY
jgi:hypothetical protein